MGILVDEINQSNFFHEKMIKNSLSKLQDIKYDRIYHDYKSRFFNEFCILLIDQKFSYGYVNTNNYNLTIKDVEYTKYSNYQHNRYCIYFKTKDLYEKIPSLLENNISVILINLDYDVTAIHHPQNKYHSSSFSFVYFPF